MKRFCPTCKHETGILKCIAKHTRWKDARFQITPVINCQDWQRRNGIKREVPNEMDTTARADASLDMG